MSALVTVADFFCGGGGSTTGLTSIPGVHVALALNHWKRAIETHSFNYPDTEHACADIAHIRPEYTPKTDMLWASPECTNFTGAKGVKRTRWEGQDGLFDGEVIPDEAAQRSRATMYDVPRFAEVHEYEIIMLENVVEVTAWRPFRGWLMSMDSLGYNHKIISMNSMHAQAYGPGAPQSRDRVYMVFWRKGNPAPDFNKLRPYAECPTHGRVQCIQAWKDPRKTIGKYRKQYNWRCPNASCRNMILEPSVRPAADAIDWTLTGSRIGDRPKKDYFGKDGEFLGHLPMAPNTMTRAINGMVDNADADNYLIEYYGQGGARGTDVPFSTFTGKDRHALIVPLRRHGIAKTLDKPLDTITGGGNHHGVLEYANQVIDDALFRMIQPHEQMWGMDFPRTYTLLGTKKEQTLQAGNSVTPPASRDIGTICVESLVAA